MLARSGKAKGKLLEKLIVAKIKEVFSFDEEDIRCTIGQERGHDIKLSRRARVKFPYAIEAKNRENFTGIYTAYAQAEQNAENLIPLLVIKSNRQKPLVILDFDYFLTLVSK